MAGYPKSSKSWMTILVLKLMDLIVTWGASKSYVHHSLLLLLLYHIIVAIIFL
jgi:hypothetical protein